ncbi:MAG: sulfatase family protein [Luteolibacter sp.]
MHTTRFLLAACFATALHAAGAGNPNIVLILADDLGYGDLGCYGATQVKTPRIDSLAAAGRRFTDAHSASAVCSPSRYGLLTGSYPLRRNLWGPTPTWTQKLTIDTHTLTLASLLKESGYATACIGKWHLGLGDPKPDWNGVLKTGPLELGFDHFFGNPGVNSYPPFVYVENHRVVGLDPGDPLVPGKPSPFIRKFPEKGIGNIGGADEAHRLYDDEKVGSTLREKSIEWIKQQKSGRPFFLYLATTHIHHPFTPAERFIGTSGCGLYGDFIHELDWIVGGVLDALEETGSAGNTLVILTSDNGGMLNVTGQKAWQSGHRINGDLQGFKFGAWEGGHRVPFLAKWPGRIPPGTSSGQLLNHVDLIATFAAVTRRELKEGKGIDSINQLESLTGNPAKPPRESMVIIPNSPRHLALRKGSWVYIPAQGAGGFQGQKPGDHLFSDAAALPFTGGTHSDHDNGRLRPGAPPAQLYNLETDPGQQRNVFADHPDVVRELDGELDHYRKAIPGTKPVGWINLKP